jgi:hypothetical protein
MRIVLALSLLLAVTEVVNAQQYHVWNPDTPRSRQILQQQNNSFTAQPLPGQLGETIQPERWGTLSKPVSPPLPPWGTIGGTGWSGATIVPQQTIVPQR